MCLATKMYINSANYVFFPLESTVCKFAWNKLRKRLFYCKSVSGFYSKNKTATIISSLAGLSVVSVKSLFVHVSFRQSFYFWIIYSSEDFKLSFSLCV